MVSEELKAIIDTLKNQGRQTESDMDFFEPATEDQISDFEKNNNLSFPSKFREWLLFSDGGECFLPASVQFYGVAHKPLIDVSNQTRPDDSYVVIGGTPNGDPVLIKKDSETISIYNKEEGKIEEEEVYDDFFAFLSNQKSMARERELVLAGKGSRNWTPEQREQLITKGKVYDADGKAFIGQHMKSVSGFPDNQGDSTSLARGTP